MANAGDALIVRILRWPGLMMQYLTTREPDDEMLEVAIASMKAAKAGPLRYREALAEEAVPWTEEPKEGNQQETAAAKES